MEVRMVKEQVQARLQTAFDTLVSLFPAELAGIVKANAYFAGGCVVDLVRDEEPRDYDVFIQTEDAVNAIRAYWADLPTVPDVEIRAVTDNAVTLGYKGYIFQIVTRFFGPTDRVFKTFDFTHCMSYFDPSTGALSYDEALIIKRQLRYNGEKDEYPLNTLKRLCKFVSRGWTPDNETITNLYKAVQKRPPFSDPEEHKMQTVGFYGSSFT
jgi:hypothetical protein